MSYATAPTFEGTRMGMRRLSALSGICGVNTLGAVADTANVLIASGWDASLINGLLQAGATDQQLTDLLNGATNPTAILTQLKAAQTSGGGINPASQPIAPASAPGAPQVPTGSILQYTVSFAATQGTNPQEAIAFLQAQLPTYRMSVMSSNITNQGLLFSAPAFSVTVLDSVGHMFLSDAKAVLDSLMATYSRGGADPGQIAIITAGGSGGILSPTGIPALPGQNLGAWFQSNWGWMALALGVLVIGPPLIKKL